MILTIYIFDIVYILDLHLTINLFIFVAVGRHVILHLIDNLYFLYFVYILFIFAFFPTATAAQQFPLG